MIIEKQNFMLHFKLVTFSFDIFKNKNQYFKHV
jgi:hypothetical protein